MESNLVGGVYRNGTTDCHVIDLDAPGSHWCGSRDEECGNQWMVICPHGGLCSSADPKMARWIAAHPNEFCEFHR